MIKDAYTFTWRTGNEHFSSGYSFQCIFCRFGKKNGFWYNEIDAGSSHSELLMECVQGLFKLSNLSQESLDLISCMKGPGSFTGLRIGFSTAKGIAMALEIPYISIPTLDCMAYPFSNWPGLILPLIDAKKGCFFSALYRGSSGPGKARSVPASPPLQLTGYSDLPPDLIVDMVEKIRLTLDEPLVLTGPGAELFLSRLSSYSISNQTILAHDYNRGRAWELLEISKNVNIKERKEIDLSPVYIRKSDAELNKSR